MTNIKLITSNVQNLKSVEFIVLNEFKNIQNDQFLKFENTQTNNFILNEIDSDDFLLMAEKLKLANIKIYLNTQDDIIVFSNYHFGKHSNMLQLEFNENIGNFPLYLQLKKIIKKGGKK